MNRYIDDEVAKIPRIALTTAPVGQNGTNFLIIGSDSRRDLVEEPRQARAHDLRIGARDELRRADEVDEEHRCQLPLHP